MRRRPELSIVSPVYMAEATIPELVARIREAVTPLVADFEIVLVDDGSADRSWSLVTDECRADPRVKGVRLSRNFGQHFALTAALAHATGDHVVVLECDLQDDPAFIPELYRRAREGWDVVLAESKETERGPLRDLIARCFYRVFGALAGIRCNPGIGSYSVLSRRVVDAFLRFRDYRRGYIMVLAWLGFPAVTVPVVRQARARGKSGYTPIRLVAMALSLIIAYSEKPLFLTIYLGILLSLLSIIAGAVVVVRYFTTNVGQVVLGWSSLMVTQFFFCGLVLMSLGVIGLYIGRIFEQVKQRPLFVVRETANLSTQAREVSSLDHERASSVLSVL